jgi:hypothetical protein
VPIFKDSERSQINNLMLHLKFIEKQNKPNWKTVDGKKKIKAEINKMGTKKTEQRNEQKKFGFLKR